MISRRTFLAGSSAMALVLAGCSSTNTPAQNVTQVAADVATIATGLQGSLTTLGTMQGLDPKKLAQVGNYVADLQKLAAQIAAASTTSAQQPLVQQVSAVLNSAVAVMATIPGLPPQVTLGFQAAMVLLPIIETAVGMAVTPPTPAATQLAQQAAAAARSHVAGAVAITTPQQARAYLQQIGQQAL